MNEQLDFLHSIADRFESAGIPYMLTGSLAMSVYTQPRMTRDVDLVVECSTVSAEDLVALFQKDCYVSEIAVREALAGGGMFNVIQLEGVTKADFIVRRDEEYRVAEFDRRIVKMIGGREVPVATAEDLFLSKLVWWRESDSALQKSDLVLLLDSVKSMDFEYIKFWAEKLNLGVWLTKIRS